MPEACYKNPSFFNYLMLIHFDDLYPDYLILIIVIYLALDTEVEEVSKLITAHSSQSNLLDLYKNLANYQCKQTSSTFIGMLSND